MIEILHDIFIGVLYLCGIGFFGFLGALLWTMTIRVLREDHDD